MDDRRNHSRAGRNRHAHEIFLPRTSRVRRLRILRNVEARQAARARHEESEAGHRAQFRNFQAQVGGNDHRQQMEAPHPGEQRGGDAESDHVGQRIEFPAKIARGVSHARDAAVQTVEQYGKADGLCGKVQVPCVTRGAMHGLQNRVETGRDIRCGEQRGQQIHAFAQFSARTV